MKSLFAAAVGLLLAVWPGLLSPFHMVDDHEVVRFLMNPDGLWERLISDFHRGRFRPLYYAFRQLQYHVFGANPAIWHAFVFGIGVVTLWLFYKLLRFYMARGWAIFGVFLLFVYPHSAAIWFRLGPQEGMGSLLVILALYALARRKTWLFVVSVIAAGFYKESFACLLPAMIVLRWFAYRHRADDVQRVYRFQLLTLVAFALIQIGAIYVTHRFSPYVNGIDVNSNIARGHSIHALEQFLFPVILLAPCLLYVAYHPRNALSGGIVLILWLVPQAILYAGTLDERYYFPAIIALSTVTAFSLAQLSGRQRTHLLGLLCACLIVVIGIPQVVDQPLYAQQWTNEAISFQARMKAIALQQPTEMTFNYPKPLEGEFRLSTAAFLRWYGYKGALSFGGNCEGAYCYFPSGDTLMSLPLTSNDTPVSSK